MKKKTKLLKLLSIVALIFCMFNLEGYSQKTTDENQPLKKPPKLLKLNQFQKTYSLQNTSEIFSEIFDESSETSFSVVKQEQDQLGYIHQKHQQYYKGVKVEFGTLTLHSNNGTVKSISSEYYEIKELETTPTLSKTQALNSAINHLGASSYLWEDEAASKELGYTKPEGELVVLPIYNNDNTLLKLAYKFEIYTIVPMGGGDTYVDANNGQLLFFNNKVRHVNNFGHDGRDFICENQMKRSTSEIVEELAIASGTAATRYSGSQTIETALSGGSYTLNDTSRQVYTRNANNQGPVGNSLPYISNYSQFTDNDNNWTAAEHDNNDKDNAALDAHWGAMMTYDYWSTVHNRDSYDNNGAQLRSYVHVDNNYDNAFWFLNVMSYGDGSSNGNEGNGYFDALTSIDVAAHEIGHAVTEYTANLAYQRESGGLNEGYSDIWGAAVEHFAKGNGNDANPDASIWLIGDEIDRRNGSAALRSMSNPTSLGQPDTYGGTYWINPNCGTPTSSNDYCGVHTNSGVLNYWFYLTVVGGNGTNDIGNNFSVSGIGMTKSATISYRAINTYLTANSTHADARIAMIQSAQDLYGSDGPEEQAVTNAWHAVGVGDAYGGGNPPANCLTGDIYLTITFDNYPEETAWDLKNSNGTTIASASYSTSNPDGSTINETFTGLAVDDYTFTITDAYGDGMCCSYGNGSYSLSSDEGTFKTGGSFGSSEATPFCIESGSGVDTEAPTAPNGLTASNITQTTVDLSWNASTDNIGVTGYDVYQGATNIGNVTGTSANITGLIANTTYSFSVVALDAAGNESSISNTVNVITLPEPDTQAPTAPTSLIASNITETTTDLSWSTSTDNVGVTGYDVYQGATNIGNVTGTSANITGLIANTTYSFSVRAIDAAGNESPASNIVNITTVGDENGCTGGISTFPYNESFEGGLGAWTQSTDDDIDWTRDASGTPSNNTGPSAGASGSWYMYVEASGNNVGFPNKRAILNSPCFDLSGESSANFSFNYHMFGSNDMGSIELEISDDDGSTWTSIWSKTGNQGNSWLLVNIDLSAYAGGSLQMRFNRLTGSTWQADIAIDNVNLSNGVGSIGCVGGASIPYTESFESSIGAWTQSSNDDIDWTRDASGTPSNNTGPSAGASGSWYMFVEASGNNVGYPNKRAILNSPCLDLSSASTASFDFNYHMYGSNDMGSIDLEISADDGVTWNSIWSESGNKGNSWLSASIDLTAYVGGGVQLRFNRVTGSTWQADIAIDNVNVTSTAAPFAGILGDDNNTSDVVLNYELSIYPNPVSGRILNIEVLGTKGHNYIIYNLIGQEIQKGSFTSKINISSLQSGMYIIEVVTLDKKFIERFIKE